MAITLDNHLSLGGTTGTLSTSYTCSGTNRLLVVVGGVYALASPAISNVTYNGVGLTRAISKAQGTSTLCEIWYMVNPPSGTYTLATSQSGGLAYMYTFASFNGVLQTSPLSVTATAGNTSANPSGSITTATDNELVIAGVEVNGTSPTPTTTTFTVIDRGNGFSADYLLGGAAGAKTATYTATSKTWAMALASFKPVIAKEYSYGSLFGF